MGHKRACLKLGDTLKWSLNSPENPDKRHQI